LAADFDAFFFTKNFQEFDSRNKKKHVQKKDFWRPKINLNVFFDRCFLGQKTTFANLIPSFKRPLGTNRPFQKLEGGYG
jgi:hypothetical protein